MREARVTAGDVSVAAMVALGYWVALVALYAALPVDAAQRAASDPLIQLCDAWGGIEIAFGLGAAPAIAWVAARRPTRDQLRRGLGWAVAGAVAALAVAGSIRALSGDTLPGFIPPEESAKPGRVLGLAAGVLEESVFRLGALPLLLFALSGRTPRAVAIAVAALATGLLFALSHELGPAGGDFDPRHFAVRTIVPGAAMSLVFVWPSPSFIVSAHCAAHLVLPALFR